MTVKIIKEGVLPENLAWPKKVTCKICKSELEYEKSDIKDGSDPRDNYTDYFITCPFCNNHQTLKANQR